MTTSTLTLTDFLLARIAEDEAQAARGWTCGQVHPQMDVSCAPHGRHPNPRAVAECEAKRRIMVLADEASNLDLGMDGEYRTASDGPRGEPWCGDRILAALAAVYADHPDYREEWKP